MEGAFTSRDAAVARHSLSMELSLRELQDKIEEYKQELAIVRIPSLCSGHFVSHADSTAASARNNSPQPRVFHIKAGSVRGDEGGV